jgi:hypothetical protein
MSWPLSSWKRTAGSAAKRTSCLRPGCRYWQSWAGQAAGCRPQELVLSANGQEDSTPLLTFADQPNAGMRTCGPSHGVRKGTVLATPLCFSVSGVSAPPASLFLLV